MAFVLVRQLVKGKPTAILATLALVMVAAIAFMVSPLSDLVGQRLENQHSNERRGQLLTETVSSTVTGSPIVGFGSTRDVQGSFASIAGASTPDCKACGVPPLGTQGHLWGVIFGQGLVGAFLFLMFFITALFRSWRCRTTTEALATCLLLFFTLQLFVYDTLGMPLFTIMIAIALAWRDQSRHPTRETFLIRVTTLGQYRELVTRFRGVLALTTAVGLASGVALAVQAPPSYVARANVLLAPPPTFLDVNAEEKPPEETTIDTEAGLVVAEGTLNGVETGDHADLRAAIRVSAAPSTRVLLIELRGDSPASTEAEVQRLAQSYLEARRDYLLQRRSQVLASLRDRYSELTLLGFTDAASEGAAPNNAAVAELRAVDEAMSDIVITPTSAGEVVRVSTAARVPPKSAMMGASGAALGLLVGVVVAILGSSRMPFGARARSRRRQSDT